MTSPISRSDQASALLHHARAATPFSSTTGEPCVSIPVSFDSRRVLPLRSAEFRDWLTANYYSEYETAPSLGAVRAALRALEAQARYGAVPEQKIDYRISYEGDPFAPSKVNLDLANPEGEIVDITARGWDISSNLAHCFREFNPMLPLPVPAISETRAEIDALNAISRLLRLSESSRARIFTWLASALRPIGPYPILVLQGPPASGKSTLARAVRALIDPSSVPLRRLPVRTRELFQAASQNWILAFDNVHRVPTKISETLCAISSGDALDVAQPDARNPVVFQIARPMILIVPVEQTRAAWMPSPSLSNRSLLLDLPPLPDLRPEAVIWSEFEALRPAALAGLCAAVSTALRRIREIDIGNVSRFPDAAIWAAAAAPAIGLEEAAVLDAFTSPASIWTGSDPLRTAVSELLGENAQWTGDASALLDHLRAFMPWATLPSTPNALAKALSRIPGITISRTKGAQGQRNLSIGRTTAPLHARAQNTPFVAT